MSSRKVTQYVESLLIIKLPKEYPASGISYKIHCTEFNPFTKVPDRKLDDLNKQTNMTK